MKGTPRMLKSRCAQRTRPAGPAAAHRTCLIAFMRPRAAVAALLAGAAALACGKSATDPLPPGAALAIAFTERRFAPESLIPLIVAVAAVVLAIGFVVALRRKPR